MPNEKIEIDIVLSDGSVAKAFASIPKAAQDAGRKASKSLDSIDGSFKNLGKNLGSLRTGFLALGAAIGAGLVINKLGGFINDVVKEASNGQVEINNLANSLRSAGTLTQGAIDSFNEFSDTIEKTTTVSKGQTLEIAALARNYSRTNEEAIRLTQASIELSAATGVDLNSAVSQLGGTLQGVGGRLSKTIPGFKTLSEEALKSGAALDLVIARFGGSAENKINTFAGSIEQLKNQFNTFLGDIGDLIIRSPAVLAVFTEIGKIFSEFSKTIGEIKNENRDILGPIIQQAVQFSLTFNQFVIKPIEIFGNAANFVTKFWTQALNTIALGLGKLGGLFARLYESILGEGELTRNLKIFEESSLASFESGATNAVNAFNNILDTSLGDNVEQTLERISAAVANAGSELIPEVKIDPKTNSANTNALTQPIDEAALAYEKRVGEIQGNLIVLRSELEVLGQLTPFASIAEDIAKLPTDLEIASIKSVQELEKIGVGFDNLKTAGGESVSFVANAVQTGLTNAISNGVQSLVTALAQGENGFKAFAGAALSSIGDLMIQIGTQIVLTSEAMQALTAALVNPTGGAGLALAAGIGLIAAGIFVKGIAGKLGGKQSAPGASLTAPGTPATPVSGGVSGEFNERQGAQIVINGDLLDADSTGLRISNILREQGFANAVIA